MNAFDAGARAFAQRIASPGLTYAMRGFSLVGEPSVLVPLAVLLAIFLVLVRRHHAALVLVIVMIGDVLLDSGLKALFQRPRPHPFFDIAPPHSYSFPSGHALASFCFFGVMALLLTAHEPRRRVRIAIRLGAAFMIAAIGLSRIYLGVHYATDVLAGYAFALLWVSIVMRLARRYVRHL